MSQFEGIQALIIEDDRTSINVLMRLLDQLDVVTAVIHDSALVKDELGGINRPDVIFLDLEMPATNGYKPLDSSLFPGQLARILNGEPVWEVP
jgi:CheY-like chemotaxis protein